MWTIIKKIPWWGWVGIVLAIFIFWQSVTGAAFSGKMWKMVKDQIVTDQTDIIEAYKASAQNYSAEAAKLKEQLVQVQKDKAALAAQKAQSDAAIVKVKEERDALQRKLDSIVVSSDPDTIIRDLQLRFPSLRKR